MLALLGTPACAPADASATGPGEEARRGAAEPERIAAANRDVHSRRLLAWRGRVFWASADSETGPSHLYAAAADTGAARELAAEDAAIDEQSLAIDATGIYYVATARDDGSPRTTLWSKIVRRDLDAYGYHEVAAATDAAVWASATVGGGALYGAYDDSHYATILRGDETDPSAERSEVFRARPDETVALVRASGGGVAWVTRVRDIANVYSRAVWFRGADVSARVHVTVVDTYEPVPLALNATAAYWSLPGVNGDRATVLAAPLDGSANPAVVVTFPTTEVAGFAVDDDYLYWCDVNAGIMAAPVAGGAQRILASVRNVGCGDALAVDDAYVYWAGVQAPGIYRVARTRTR